MFVLLLPRWLLRNTADRAETVFGHLRYKVSRDLHVSLSTLHILERVAGKISIHLSQFSETTALCWKY